MPVVHVTGHQLKRLTVMTAHLFDVLRAEDMIVVMQAEPDFIGGKMPGEFGPQDKLGFGVGAHVQQVKLRQAFQVLEKVHR